MSNVKIKLKRGDDEQRQVDIVWASDDGQTEPYDLINTTRADLHAKVDGQVVISLSTETGGIEITDRPNGTLLLDFAHTLTEQADWHSADYDLQLIDNQGKRKTVLSGRIELSHDVTKVDI